MRALFVTLLLVIATAVRSQWTYQADTSATWAQAIERYTDLASAHQNGAHLLEIGHDDDGHPLHLVVLTDGTPCHPDSIRKQGKNILWITNGIHPGEPDGIDASLMLAQALLEDDYLIGLTAKTVVCIVPVYNVSGALRRNAFSRANQNGPKEYGFRANARNLDLNRDFIKADAENTRSMEKALAYWDPDIYFETHVSDGADHQYVMELLTTQKDKLDGGLSQFLTNTMIPGLYEWMGRKQLLMCPYFESEGEKPEDGLYAFYDAPRYSTGYNALFDRIGILAESHMLKPYADRVNATFQLMLGTLAMMDQRGAELRKARLAAKKHTAEMDEIGLNWKLDTALIEQLPWKGWAAEKRTSNVSGQARVFYDHAHPTETTVPWCATYRASIIKQKPRAYIVPAGWVNALPQLWMHDLKRRTLTRDTTITVEIDNIVSFETGRSPYEGHYMHRDVHCTTQQMKMRVPAGSVIIPMGQVTDRYVMETLEAEAEDSYFAWGFFDSILQQKEWFSDYVFEEIAADLLAKDPALAAALQAQREKDPEFAKDAWAQLYFVYQRSPYFEQSYRIYPVMRIAN